MTYERRDGRLTGFSITGHAGFAPAGRDIVCAAVSALVLAAAHGLRVHCGIQPSIADTGECFSLRLAQRDWRNGRAQAVLATMVSGLEAVARSHPGYVTVRRLRAQPTGPRRRVAKASRSKTRGQPSSAPRDIVER